MASGGLYSLIYITTVLSCVVCLRQHFGSFVNFCELKLAFVGTKFSQKVRVRGITNRSVIEYMTARVEYDLFCKQK